MKFTQVSEDDILITHYSTSNIVGIIFSDYKEIYLDTQEFEDLRACFRKIEKIESK